MKELKDLLTPPFEARYSLLDTLCIYDSADRCAIEGYPLPAGFFEQKITKEERKEFSQLLTAALNNEWQRQFGGERWVFYEGNRYCPKCGVWFSIVDSHNDKAEYNYCPYCGIKLPPEEGDMMPIRIQRKRTKGWKMPPNTVYVGRGSRWGNPFVNPEVALECYRKMVTSLVNWRDHAKHGYSASYFDIKGKLITLHPEELQELRGKNLACWCPLDKPCHADVLLELANEGGKQ